MNRYNVGMRNSKLNANVVMNEDDFIQQKSQQQLIHDLKFKSIPSKKVLLDESQLQEQDDHVDLIHQVPQRDQTIQYSDTKEEIPLEQELKIQYSDSKQGLKLNNFFGSKKQLQRPSQSILQNLNPQNRIRRQFKQEQDSNDKLAKMIQKQIQDRKNWQQKQKLEQQQKRLRQNASDLAIINNKDSFNKKMMSQDKLKKINLQKYSANNIEQNNIFAKNTDENDDYIRMSIKKQENQEKESPVDQKRKKSTSQLRPLKKKQSTVQVLNQFQYLTRNQQGKIQNVVQKPQQKAQQIILKKQQQNPLVKQRIIALDIDNLQQFNKQGIPNGKFIQGLIKRNKDGFDNTFFPEFRMIFDDVNIIYSKKTMTGYDIGMDPLYKNLKSTGESQEKLLGNIKGNFKGSVYNLYEKRNQNEIIATISYTSDSSLPYRQVQLYVKDEDLSYFDLDRMNPTDKTSNLKTLFLQGENEKNKKIRKYINRKPILNKKTGQYGLDFGIPGTVASVKNVILLDAQTNQTVMIFTKYGNDKFYIKADKLSPLVIMSYLMSSFNFKFVTQ